ncbi:transposase domain-containing protein, partial [Acuticoccus sediminis]|uniref:transposase domain-containing protein n=1 Tax=Acuticoccus sediminis TaxID=2184697 RepID=UPI001FD52F8B
LNDVDPQAWLADVLARIAAMPQGRLPELNASKNPHESGPLILGRPEGKRCGDSLVSSTSRIVCSG